MSHYAGVVVYRYVDDTLYFLIQGQRPIKSLSDEDVVYKFPGGSNSDHPEEQNPHRTALRELEEETHLTAPRGYQPTRVFSTRNVAKDHRRFFYLIPFDALCGELRTEEISDNEHILLPPQWVSEKEIRQRFLHGERPLICDTHRPVLKEALHALLDREFTLV